MLRSNRNHIAALCLALVIIAVTLGPAHGVDATNRSSRELQISNQNSMRSFTDSISGKLLQIRHLLKSLFSDWNFGESEGVGRTFGRIRAMRQIMLPLAFLGGFLTAVILGIKVTGVINMALISSVLMINLALFLGKLLYGMKDLFYPKYVPVYQPPPYYPPSGHGGYGHSSYGHSGYGHGHGGGSFSQASAYANSRQDNFNPGQQFPQQFSSPSSFPQQQPQFNQPINQSPNYNQPQQMNFGQPQSGPFNGISMQSPQQVLMSQNPSQFNQPFSQGRMQKSNDLSNVESIDNRILNEDSANTPIAQQLIQMPDSTLTTMSPQQMTQLLSDAIALMSAQTTPSSISSLRKRSPNHLSIFRLAGGS